MKVLWIVLAVLAALLLLILAVLFFGKATVRIVCKKKLRLVLKIGIIPITLISDKEKKAPELKRCKNPKRVLKKELRLQEKRRINAAKKKQKKAKKAERKAEKRSLAGGHNKPNVIDYAQMIQALLGELYAKTAGNIDFRIRRLHIYVASGDAATTAILYSGTVQALLCLIRWIELNFNRVERRPGDAEVIADFGAKKTHVDVDLSATLYLFSAISVAIGMLRAYHSESNLVQEAADLRTLAKQYAKDSRSA